MEQDYIKRQIEIIGQILGKVLSKMIGLKSTGNIDEAIGIVNQTFKSELDFDIDELVACTDIIAFLNEKKIGYENIAKLIDIILFVADSFPENQKEILYKKSLLMYKYLEEKDKIFSVERHQKIDEIRKGIR